MRRGDLLVEGDRIAAVGGDLAAGARDDAETVDADGLCLAPGLVDMRVQLREPGAEHMESIESGGAGRGGRRGHDDGRAAQHRPADRRRLGGRVPRPPGARGQARQGLHLCRARPRGCAGRDLAEMGLLAANGARRLHRRRAGGGRRARHAAGAGLRPHLRPAGDAAPRGAEPRPRRRGQRRRDRHPAGARRRSRRRPR